MPLITMTVMLYDMNTGESKKLTTSASAAEGVYYDGDTDEIILASCSSNQINAYTSISSILGSVAITASISSSSDVQSPRDIAVNNSFVIVSDNADVDTATADGRLFVYSRANSALTLRNVLTIDFALWGIEMGDNDLYAVVDKTNQLAVFANFTVTKTTNATVSASKRIAIEGIVRTHGLAYRNGTMILTDIGDAASDSDGGFHVITNFDSKFSAVSNGGVMAVAGNQTRVAGSATMMENPVSVDYDAVSNTVFIANAANGGGRVLAFTNTNAEGNIAPSTNYTLSKASSLYFCSN
jgi:hypothetical protein